VVESGPGGEAAVRAAAAELGRRSLVLAGDDGTAWGWIGRPSDERRSPADRLTAHLARIELSEDSRIASGGSAGGLEGFRRTHREAQAAHSVALRGNLAVARYEDVALETLALGAERRTRDFIARELGPLGEETQRSQRMREKLVAYFAARQNAAAAAAKLDVNERTVRNRLHEIEEKLGYEPTARRAELEAALRFAALLPHERFE
jgi:DNA-binding PucR family transcriptional regulator